MSKILVAYDTGYGATQAAAEVIAKTLAEQGVAADLRPVGETGLAEYDALILGSPIRLGQCTAKVKKFIKQNQAALSNMPTAFFFTCMSVTNPETELDIPLYADPAFSAPGRPPARMKIMEGSHAATYYLKQYLKLAPGVRPLSIAFFKGNLHTGSLSPLHRLIMRFAMWALPEVTNGDFLDPAIVESWAQGLINNMAVVSDR